MNEATVKRLVMWSGPRNISTAMMRAFENRPDCAVWDEPFYAAYLKHSGIVHPMQDEIIEDGLPDRLMSWMGCWGRCLVVCRSTIKSTCRIT